MATEAVSPMFGIADQVPLLIVVVPMIAAPLCIVFGNRKAAAFIAFFASLISLLCSIHILASVMDGSIISYWLGGWGPVDGGIPKGIEYRIDAANAFVLMLISLMSTIVLPYAKRSVEQEIRETSHTLFYCCYLLCFTGLLGVVATGDAFNVFVFLEISSLSTYVLVAMGAEKDKRALTSAFEYLIMGTIGATFFVIGIGFLYAATGTLNMADMAVRLAELEPGNRTVQVAFAFILVGMGLKAAMYPLHLWLPGAYTFAPSVVTAFLAATATKAAIYVLLRFTFTIFGFGFVSDAGVLPLIVIPVAVIAMFAGSLIAVFQTDLKRLLAYSSVAQVGYMILGIGFMSTTGITATVVHMFNHGITKGLLFMAVGAFVMRSGSSFTDRLCGLGRQMPWTAGAFVIGGISLIGVPGTSGFISKWVLVTAALEKDWWWMALLIVASSLLAVIYVWRIVEILFLQPPKTSVVAKEVPLSMIIPAWVLALACIWFGSTTEVTIGAAEVAANGFIGVRQ